MQYKNLTGACGLLAAVFVALPACAQSITEPFNPWPGNTSPDGLFRRDGNWIGTGGNLLSLQDERFVTSFDGKKGGFFQLVVPGGQTATPYQAGEWASTGGLSGTNTHGYGYGYYETRMQVSSTPGVCASFFWIEAPNYGPHEWDVEFLTNESWIGSANSGQVHLTLHPSNATYVLKLPFNPSKAMHRYGFLWKSGTITFTVDGKAAYTFNNSDLTTTAQGFIMANEWTGNPNWGGGPPAADAVTTYGYVKFGAALPAIPAW